VILKYPRREESGRRKSLNPGPIGQRNTEPRIWTSENASLPLCVSFRHISWMTPKWGRGWLENALPLEMAVEESPLGP
jgi:hypothetical protein